MKPNLYDYSDFRTYLGDTYLHRKQKDSAFSYKRFAQQAGLGSPNYLKLIIDGDRQLTVTNIHRFAQALELTYTEIQYFEALVHLCQAESTREKSYYRARVSELSRGVSRKLTRKPSSTALLDEPSTMGVVLCLHGANTVTAATEAAEKTGVKPERVQKIIQVLVGEELLNVVQGKFELTEKYIKFQDRKSRSGGQKKYFRAQLDASVRALETRYERDAKFYCNTFTIAEDSLEILQDRVSGWIDDLMERTNAESPEKIMQLNLQLFPVK